MSKGKSSKQNPRAAKGLKISFHTEPVAMDDTVCYRQWNSPVGKLLIAATSGEVILVDWVESWHKSRRDARMKRLLSAKWEEGANELIDSVVSQLERYFADPTTDFDLPIGFYGSPFQCSIWKALMDIPLGKLSTYGELGRHAGHEKGARAVGAAVGDNPFSIIVPCHRVIGSSRTLTGYGGGFDAKRKLLALEMNVCEDQVEDPAFLESKLFNLNR